jgi:hypothetical protein
MAFRDDRDALLHRAEALGRESDRARHEAAELRAENDRLREENERLRARIPEPPAPALEVTAPPAPARPGRSWRAAAAAGAGLATFAVALAVAPALSVIPAGVGAAWLGRAAWRRWSARRRRDPDALPVDQGAYAELLATPRHTVVVQIDARFATRLVPDQRRQALQVVTRAGLRAHWEDDLLIVRSRRIRLRRPRSAPHDPGAIARFCEAAFARLAIVHASWPLAAVTPRPRTAGPPASRHPPAP